MNQVRVRCASSCISFALALWYDLTHLLNSCQEEDVSSPSQSSSMCKSLLSTLQNFKASLSRLENICTNHGILYIQNNALASQPQDVLCNSIKMVFSVVTPALRPVVNSLQNLQHVKQLAIDFDSSFQQLAKAVPSFVTACSFNVDILDTVSPDVQAKVVEYVEMFKTRMAEATAKFKSEVKQMDFFVAKYRPCVDSRQTNAVTCCVIIVTVLRVPHLCMIYDIMIS